MKLMSASMLCLCMVLVGCADSPAGPGSEITDATNQVQASVQGMTCAACTGEVCDAVEGIDGVAKAHADLKTGTVTVALDDDADADAASEQIEAVIAALSDGKYTVGNVDAVSTCSADCTKPCCAGEGEAKTCPPDCDKPCCKEATEAKTCPADCTKPCCKPAPETTANE